MSLLGWILMGLIAGWLARRVIKDDRTGCIYTVVVGIIGALVGGALFSLVTDREGVIDELSLPSIGVAFIGACAFLLLLKAITSVRTR
jgi:uncharacterized membrane protein YeaQ/YmgE (transglycosylase-associated protein family)